MTRHCCWHSWQRSFVAVLAVVAVFENQLPAAEPREPSVAERYGASLIPADAAGFACLRIDEILNVPWVKEALKKSEIASLIDSALDEDLFVGKLTNVQRIIIVHMPPTEERDDPGPIVIVGTIQPVDRDRLMKSAKDRGLTQSKSGKFTVYSGKGKYDTSYSILNDTTTVSGPVGDLEHYCEQLSKKDCGGSLDEVKFESFDPKAQLVAALIPERLLKGDDLRVEVPTELKPIAPLLATDWLCLEGRFEESIVFSARAKCHKKNVEKTVEAAEAGRKMLAELIAAPIEDKLLRDDPSAKNLVKLLKQLQGDMTKSSIESSGDSVQMKFQSKLDAESASKAFAEAIQQIHDASILRTARWHLIHVGIAMNNMDAQTIFLPEPAIYDKDGKPLLSWRVAILPYMDDLDGKEGKFQKLYDEFKLDEPWDSEHNKKLLAKMPEIYASPGIALKDKSLTYYKIFVGQDAIFDHGRKTSLNKIPAGSQKTVLAIEAGDPVPWTKPEDFPFDPKKPLPKLVGPYKKVLHVLMADAHCATVPADIDPEKLQSAIDRNVGYELRPLRR